MADAASENFQLPINATEASIEVRDDTGPVMRVRFTVEIDRSESNRGGSAGGPFRNKSQ